PAEAAKAHKNHGLDGLPRLEVSVRAWVCTTLPRMSPGRLRAQFLRSPLTRGAVACAALWLSMGGVAHAQPVPSLDLRNFHPPTDHQGGLYLEPTSTPGPMAFNVGSWLSYAHHPVSLNAGDDVIGRPVAGQFSLDWFTSLGVGDRLALSLTVPTVVYQFESGDTSGVGEGSLPTYAMGDASFGAKATLVPTSSLGGLGL